MKLHNAEQNAPARRRFAATVEKALITVDVTIVVPVAPDPSVGLDLLARGNLDVFMDMYPQMLAYHEGGIDAIQQMRTNFEIEESQLVAWGKIAQGSPQSVWQGNTELLDFEQRVTLQNGAYAANQAYWAQLTSASMPVTGLVAPMPSPIPGDNRTFQQFRVDENQDGTDDVSDTASIGDFSARWAWITQKQLPAYQAWSGANNRIDVKKLLDGGYKQR